MERIGATDYANFFDRASQARWGKHIPSVVTQHVLTLTHRHPYYVNALCARLWEVNKPPTVNTATTLWRDVVAEDAPIVAYQVRNLSATQRAMLVGIATASTVEFPTGREFLAHIRLSASTGSAAKDVLEANDLIRQNDEGHWQLVDPVMAEYIRNISA